MFVQGMTDERTDMSLQLKRDLSTMAGGQDWAEMSGKRKPTGKHVTELIHQEIQNENLQENTLRN